MRKFENWTVAYRQRKKCGTLLDDIGNPFICIRNTWRYWCADPHLFVYNQTTYIFAELYDRVLRRGVIGYCTLAENGPSPWKVALNMPFHLSYPHIMQKGNDVYMVPESYVANEIAVYRAVSFPDRWEKVYILKSDYCAVDTTFFSDDSHTYAFTFRFIDDTERLMLYSVDDRGFSDNGICVSDGDSQMRPAGHLFRSDGALYRPAQDCTESYGCALNLYKIESSEPYKEILEKKITPDMINSDLGRKAEGIHTYNMSDEFEVIDLKGYETDIWFYVMRPVWFIWRRVKRIFSHRR